MLKPGSAPRAADDLFESSSMSFGEHLEELRKALARAFIWVAIGVGGGLFLADYVVSYIQRPLEVQLEKYYIQKSRQEMQKQAGEAVSDDLFQWMQEIKFSAATIYLDREVIAAVARDLDGSSDSTLDTLRVPPDSSVLVPLRQFNRVAANTEALNLTEPFMIWLKAGLVTGVVLASPGIFWHIWAFVAAGLYPHERRYVHFFIPFSLVLFLAGVSLAFFVVFHLVIEFLLTFNSRLGIGATPRLSEYMTFALLLPLGFGVAFQLPLVMLILERVGILSVETYKSQWRVAFLIIAFCSMLLTPAELTSMVAMMVPVMGLYFLGIGLCMWLPRGPVHGRGGYDPS
jgi:sec-independent protein translocase protein TatC